LLLTYLTEIKPDNIKHMYLNFLHVISLLDVQELKRRDMLICIFPIQLSLHLIISLENFTRPLIYGWIEYARFSDK
jgi:hypothetical protein